jgi:hypothetical protein
MSFQPEGAVQKCMDRGMFKLHHAWPWPEYENGRAEYWRGYRQGGGVIFFRDDNGSPVRGEYHPLAGDALRALDRSGYFVPGVSHAEGIRQIPIF